MAWYCSSPVPGGCFTTNLERDQHCRKCHYPRSKACRPAKPPIPVDVAFSEYLCRLNGDYMSYFEDAGQVITSPTYQHVLNTVNIAALEGRIKEPDEMRQLLEWGWIKVGEGHYQREVDPPPVMYFEPGSSDPKYVKR